MLYKTLCNTVELVLISREIVWINDSSYSDLSERSITRSERNIKTSLIFCNTNTKPVQYKLEPTV